MIFNTIFKEKILMKNVMQILIFVHRDTEQDTHTEFPMFLFPLDVKRHGNPKWHQSFRHIL